MEERRAQKRLQVSVPVMIGGVDTEGKHFVESTYSRDLSRRGMSLLTGRSLAAKTTLTVVIPARWARRGPGREPSHFFTSAWVVDASKKDGMSRIALRFMGATLPIYAGETS